MFLMQKITKSWQVAEPQTSLEQLVKRVRHEELRTGGAQHGPSKAQEVLCLEQDKTEAYKTQVTDVIACGASNKQLANTSHSGGFAKHITFIQKALAVVL